MLFLPTACQQRKHWSLLIPYWSLWLFRGFISPGYTQSVCACKKLIPHLHQPSGGQQIQQHSLLNLTIPTPWLGHLQWGLQVFLTITGTIKVQHIKSHQDSDTNTPKTLPLPARLYILADAESHKAYTDFPTFHQVPFLPSTPVALVLNRLHVTYMFLSIDWLASDKEYKQLSTGCWFPSFKLQNALWPMQYVLHQCKPAQSPTCPRCHLSPETHDHVLCCPQAQTS